MFNNDNTNNHQSYYQKKNNYLPKHNYYYHRYSCVTTVTNYNEHLLSPHTPKHHYTFLHTVYPYPHPHLPTHQDTPNYTAHASSLSCFILTTKPRNGKSLCAYQNLTLIYNTTRHPSPINQPRPIPYSTPSCSFPNSTLTLPTSHYEDQFVCGGGEDMQLLSATCGV